MPDTATPADTGVARGAFGVVRGTVAFDTIPCERFLERGGPVWVVACTRLVPVDCTGRFHIPLDREKCDAITLHVDREGLVSAGEHQVFKASGDADRPIVLDPPPVDEYVDLDAFVSGFQRSADVVRDYCESNPSPYREECLSELYEAKLLSAVEWANAVSEQVADLNHDSTPP